MFKWLEAPTLPMEIVKHKQKYVNKFVNLAAHTYSKIKCLNLRLKEKNQNTNS